MAGWVDDYFGDIDSMQLDRYAGRHARVVTDLAPLFERLATASVAVNP